VEQSVSSYIPIFVAVLAGLFSFLGLLIAKETKVSEFRQSGVDALRGEIASFVAAVSFIAQAQQRWIDNNKDLTWSQMLTLIGPAMDSASSAQTAILLRLSLYDRSKETEALIAAVKAVRETVNKPESTAQEAQDMAYGLHVTAAPVLEREWRRVKSGERFYLISKWVAAAIVVLSLVGAIAYWVRLQRPPGPNQPANQSLPG
jgi:hypothetical protein